MEPSRSTLIVKALEAWGAPLGAGWLLGVAGLLLRRFRPRLGTAVLVLGLGLLWAFGSGAVSDRLLARLEKAYPIPAESVRADAALVLAGTVDVARSTPDRVELYDRTERIIEGARLVKRGRARWLVISGGSGDPLRPEVAEAEHLAALARELGVSPSVTLLEEKSRTTAENARLSASLLKQHGIGRFFLVTSAFHMPRAVACFRKLGLDPVPYPVDFRAWPDRRQMYRYTPTAPALAGATLAVHEYIGYAVYWLTGRI